MTKRTTGLLLDVFIVIAVPFGILLITGKYSKKYWDRRERLKRARRLPLETDPLAKN